MSFKLQDNGIRSGTLVGVISRKAALLECEVAVLPGHTSVRVVVRLRGIAPMVLEDGGNTFDTLLDEIKKGEEITIQFHRKPYEDSSVPFLVDIFRAKDGLHVNKWLVENKYANEFIRGGRDEE